jgi:hypothetical protein
MDGGGLGVEHVNGEHVDGSREHGERSMLIGGHWEGSRDHVNRCEEYVEGMDAEAEVDIMWERQMDRQTRKERDRRGMEIYTACP